jgi:ferredoxin
MMARAVTQDGATAAHRPSRERQRLTNAMAHLPTVPPQASESSSLPIGSGFASVSISEECTACGVCARACPTGALQFYQEGESHYRLMFAAQACIGCDVCCHVCMPGAVTVDAQPTFDAVFGPKAPLALREGDLIRCSRCHALTAARPGARLCPTCEFRRQNPFGSRPVPGLTKVRP